MEQAFDNMALRLPASNPLIRVYANFFLGPGPGQNPSPEAPATLPRLSSPVPRPTSFRERLLLSLSQALTKSSTISYTMVLVREAERTQLPPSSSTPAKQHAGPQPFPTPLCVLRVLCVLCVMAVRSKLETAAPVPGSQSTGVRSAP
jgi:hypothetical protein